jgi:hypothetical protein
VRGGSAEGWMEFGKHGPEDMEALRVAAVKQTLAYCQRTLPVIETMRSSLIGLTRLFALIWIGAAIVMIFAVQPQELPAVAAAFAGVISAGGAVLGAVGLCLRRMESEMSIMLRSATGSA